MNHSTLCETFVRKIWRLFIPTYYLPSRHDIKSWLTADVFERMPRQVNYDTVIQVVHSSDWVPLFDQARAEITNSWDLFTPDAKNEIISIISDLNMWEYFDQAAMKITSDDKNFLRARWRQSDILYNNEKTSNLQALHRAGLSIDDNRIHGETQAILSGIETIIYMRGHFDVAMLYALDIKITPFILSYVKSRVMSEYFDFLEFLREALLRSTIFKMPNGTYITDDMFCTLSYGEMLALKGNVEERLEKFKNSIDAFVRSLDTLVPSKYAYDLYASMSNGGQSMTNITISGGTFTASFIGNTDTYIERLNVNQSSSNEERELKQKLKELRLGIDASSELQKFQKTSAVSDLVNLTDELSKSEDNQDKESITGFWSRLKDTVSVSAGLTTIAMAIGKILGLAP